MNNIIVIDLESIDKFSKGIKEESGKMYELLDEMIEMSREMEKFYDTPVAQKMKEVLIDFLMKSKDKCKDFEEYGKKIERIHGRYSITLNQMNERVSKGN